MSPRSYKVVYVDEDTTEVIPDILYHQPPMGKKAIYCQYTGLLADKQAVYEGDVLEWDGITYMCNWDNSQAAYEFPRCPTIQVGMEMWNSCLDADQVKTSKIVGNIHVKV